MTRLSILACRSRKPPAALALLFSGALGLAITVCLNVVALLWLERSAAVPGSSLWWATWFPPIAVWCVLGLAGVGAALHRGRRRKAR